MDKKNTRNIMISAGVVLLSMVVVVLGTAYAYYTYGPSTSQSQSISATATTYGTLEFTATAAVDFSGDPGTCVNTATVTVKNNSGRALKYDLVLETTTNGFTNTFTSGCTANTAVAGDVRTADITIGLKPSAALTYNGSTSLATTGRTICHPTAGGTVTYANAINIADGVTQTFTTTACFNNNTSASQNANMGKTYLGNWKITNVTAA